MNQFYFLKSQNLKTGNNLYFIYIYIYPRDEIFFLNTKLKVKKAKFVYLTFQN
jgi:hypothetical protein